MSTATDFRCRRRQALTIVMLFLIADLLAPDAIPRYQLEDEDPVLYPPMLQISNNSTADSQIYSQNPNSNYGIDDSAQIGSDQNGESKMVISFPLFTNSSFFSYPEVVSAEVELVCSTEVQGDQKIQLYVSALSNSFSESNVTWLNRTGTSLWNSPGASGAADHGDWEPPSVETMNATFSLNVTALVQHAVSNGDTSIDLLIESFGAAYSCSTREELNPFDIPKILISYTMGGTGAPSSGSLSPNFIGDGMPLMSGDFILTANTLPTLTWMNQVGQDVEVQLSLSDSFKNENDQWWYYSSMSNSTFQFSGTNGQMLLPTENELDNGTTMHYRMRALDNHFIGNWSSGYFHLPDLQVTDNGNGTASVSISATSLGLAEDAIADTYSSDVASGGNQNHGSDTEVIVGMDYPFGDQYGYHKFEPRLWGMHGNATILQADMVLTRDSHNNDGVVSFHSFNYDDWTENELTMNRPDASSTWTDGGRTHKNLEAIDTFWSNQSDDEYRLNLVTEMQNWIDTASTDSLSIFSTIRGDYEQHQSSTYVEFFSKEDSTESNQPSLELIYKWGSGSTPGMVEQLLPDDGVGLWNVSNHNLSGNTTPTIEWNTTGATVNSYDIIFELSKGPEFRNVTTSVNTIDDSDFAPDDGTFDLPILEAGTTYAWRMQHVDTDGHRSQWSSSTFFIPSLTSNWIGGDSYELRLSLGNSSSSGPDMPMCYDTYIDSGSPNSTYSEEGELQVSYNAFSEATILLGCNLASHFLPSGYAVSYANMRMKLSYASGNPSIGVWDNTQNNVDETATWSTYDGVNNWSQSGAKGSERGSLLSSSTISSAIPSGSWITWNITLGAQDAMRGDGSLDLIIGMLSAGSGVSREALLYSNEEPATSRPELILVYTLGSDAIPNNPIPTSPVNGSWSVNDGIEPSPDVRPILKWNYSNTVGAGGWSVQLDTTETFDGPNLQNLASWNDIGFDVTNLTYTPQQDLTEGFVWHWRVRAVSMTNQLGNWSPTFNFLLPDITTWLLDSNTSAVEYHHHDALPTLNIPEFEDTWIVDGGANINVSSGSSDTLLRIGRESDGSQASALLRIPLSALPNPSNAHVSEATLNLYAIWGSSTTQHVSIHPSLQAWNDSANGATYDGTNNWSTPGGLGTMDRGPMVDVHSILQGAAWTSFDVTELVQQATLTGSTHLSMMIIGDDAPGLVEFRSVEASSDRPWLNITWETGNASQLTSTGSPVSPVNGVFLWNTTSHALLPADTPTLKWTHSNMPSIDDWRVYVWNNASNEREGWSVHDTRTAPSGFSYSGNHTMWTPTISQDTGKTYRWFVQPIVNDILGVRSGEETYYLPSVMSGEINSTDAWINIADGSLVPDSNYPNVMQDTWIDQGSPSINYGNTTNMTIGGRTSAGLMKRAIIEIDISNLPIPGPYDITDATLSLYRDGGLQTEIFVSASDLYVGFNESTATWNSPWQVGGAGEDTSLPVDIQNVSMAATWYDWDVTQLAQAAIARGDNTVRLLLKSEGQIIAGHHTFSSSEHPNVDWRPQFNITIRSTTPWLQGASFDLDPVSGQTMWNMSSAIPSPVDNLQASWLSDATGNSTIWHVQKTNDPRFMTDVDDCFSISSDPCSADWTFASTSHNSTTILTTFTSSENASDITNPDQWNYWRVRSIEDYRISNWSTINHFRMPDYEGEDDGYGNLTLLLNRGSIFVNTTLLPSVPDTMIDSTSPSTTYGGSTTISLGVGTGGSGESRILIEFDLNEVPFPANMTPTSTILSMYRSGITGGQSITVAAYACSSFSELGGSWNNAPNCSTTEITRTTLAAIPATGYVDWDITSLAQSNIAAGNRTLTIMLAVIGTPGATHEFRSSEYFTQEERPHLEFDYVDNSNGVVPPGQPVLIHPADGDVMYDNTNWILEPGTRPILQWNPVTNATDYILTIANSTGQTKFRTWEDSGFSGENFTTSSDLAAGESYEWWVQAINGSIPGPSSSRWTFAIGNPINNTYNLDNTYTYQIRHSEEVPTFGHANMVDSVIDESAPASAIEDDDLMIGTDSNGYEKRSIFVLDPSQFPLPVNANIHSASLGLYVENSIMNAGIPMSTMTISAHPILTSGYTPLGTTWNDVSANSAWGAPGMQSGVDYGPATDTVTVSASVMFEGWIWFDISHSGLDLTNSHQFVLIATGQAYLDISHSQDDVISQRPIMLVNYTHVDHVTITPGSGASTDADNTIQYTYAMFDPNGSAVSGPIEWSTSTGSISSSGLFQPSAAGVWDVEACFGLVCDVVSVTVTPGVPVSWYGNFVSDSGNRTLDANQGATFSFAVYDQHGNIVSGETITAFSTNGTLTTLTPDSNSTHSWRWSPWATGNQTVQMTWNSQAYTENFLVVAGVPVLVSIGNCDDGDLIVPAGTTCVLSWDVIDSKGNQVDKSELGLVTWEVEELGGNITGGNFTADKIGIWEVNLTSAYGLDANTTVEVIYGSIYNLELNASSLVITADDLVYINTTRVDTRGNRLQVDLETENWTVSNGWLTPGTGGGPAVWEPETVGSKIIRGSYDGAESELIIAVSHGIISLMEIDITTPTNLTADEQSLLKSYGVDAKGNRWSVNVEWMIAQDTQNNNDWLYGYVAGTKESTVIFKPTFVGEYNVRAIYTEAGSALNFMVSTDYTITHGELDSVAMTSPTECTSGPDDDPHWTNDCIWEMTTDETIQFSVSLEDKNGNPINDEIIEWTMNGIDITDSMENDSNIWSGVRNEGLYVLRAQNGSIFDQISINISHGRAIVVNHEVSASSVEAGISLTAQMTGTDVAGNTFFQDVTWSSPAVVQTGIGAYRYDAATQGTYDLVYELAGAQGGTWSVTVAPSSLSEFIIEIDKDTLEQQDSVTITISAFDRFGNPVPVPTGSALTVDATGRGVVSEVDADTTRYSVETLDDGSHTITISTLVSGQIVSGSVNYNVTGTIPGFFASGGPLYYAAGGLGGIILIVLIVLVIIIFRRSTDDYEEDDWDVDEEDKETPVIAPTEPESDGVTGDDSYRVDDDGTEWWEDESGVWWFKEPGDEDWQEWKE